MGRKPRAQVRLGRYYEATAFPRLASDPWAQVIPCLSLTHARTTDTGHRAWYLPQTDPEVSFPNCWGHSNGLSALCRWLHIDTVLFIHTEQRSLKNVQIPVSS